MSAPPPRWAIWAAYAVPLCVLPSALWRFHLMLTMPGAWYPALLGFLQIGAGLLTLGLVHSWGEVVPGWIPVLGGRRVPALAAVVPAMAGAVVIMILCAYGILNGVFEWVTPEQARSVSLITSNPVPGTQPPDGWVTVIYAPLVAWGPLLAAVTLAYHRRRRQEKRCVPMPAPLRPR